MARVVGAVDAGCGCVAAGGGYLAAPGAVCAAGSAPLAALALALVPGAGAAEAVEVAGPGGGVTGQGCTAIREPTPSANRSCSGTVVMPGRGARSIQ